MSREDKSTRRVVGEPPWQGTPLPIRAGRRAWRMLVLGCLAVAGLLVVVGLIGWTVFGAL